MWTVILACIIASTAVSVNAGSCSASNELCCKDSETCCSGGCCPFSSGTCCSDNKCCPSTHTVCCPNGCCSSNYPVCCSDHCCPTTHQTCCGTGCCPNAYPVCCGSYCCPSGSYCCGNKQCCTSLGLGRRSIETDKAHPLLRVSKNEKPLYDEITLPSLETKQDDDQPSENQPAVSVDHPISKRQITITNLGQCFNYDRLKLNEGYKTCKYFDSEGIATIGVGFNLEKNGAREKITAVGADYDKVLSGQECLNDKQIQQLLQADVNTAVACAKTFPPNWYQLHSGAQSAIADMAFNLGCAGLKKFKCFRNALARLDYQWAAEEMKDSKWCKQVKIRCTRNVQCMQSTTG